LDDLKKGITDYTGRFVITGVSAGWHVITVKKTGYSDAIQRENIQRDVMLLIRMTR
jgi:hypothetical protein